MSTIMQIPKTMVPLLALALSNVVALPGAQAADAAMMAPDAMKWADGPPVLPSGAQIALLSGDPHQEGPFVFRLRFPADYEVPAHTHSIAELVTVISGTLNFGHGKELDRGATQALPAGGFVAIPAGHPHFVWTEDEVVVQIHGDGPFDIKYIDPTDDPREKQAAK